MALSWVTYSKQRNVSYSWQRWVKTVQINTFTGYFKSEYRTGRFQMKKKNRWRFRFWFVIGIRQMGRVLFVERKYAFNCHIYQTTVKNPII